jgi:tetratricopeptide (TPR) repeat protein
VQGAPIDVVGLSQAAAAALSKGEAERARDLLDQIVAAKRADASTWLAMAQARALLRDGAGKAAAIEAALAMAPNDLSVLIAKADQLASEGDQRGASTYYAAALQYMPRYARLPPHLQEALRRAKAANERVVRELDDFVRAKLDAEGFGETQAPPRFARAVDVLLGKKRAYAQEPRYLYFPELPNIQFYDRGRFPELDAVEAAFEDIRAELLAVIGGDFKPYVTKTLGRPQGDEKGMLNNPNWSAYFLHKDGAPQPGAARCPRALAALADAPLTDIPGRAPSILFSKLAAGAHIPAHTGMLNVRLICHLPLIVPAGCEFRVGNDVRAWEEGKLWVFDDTIEHEAWNRSGEDRYILLFDIWRPELTAEERAGVAALCQAIDAFGGKVAWDA